MPLRNPTQVPTNRLTGYTAMEGVLLAISRFEVIEGYEFKSLGPGPLDLERAVAAGVMLDVGASVFLGAWIPLLLHLALQRVLSRPLNVLISKERAFRA